MVGGFWVMVAFLSDHPYRDGPPGLRGPDYRYAHPERVPTTAAADGRAPGKARAPLRAYNVGVADAFPETRWTRIVAARGSPELRREVLDELCASRWQPLYVHLRKQGLPPDRAQDVVQGFLVHLLERDFLARLDPGRGRLRAYLKTALAHYLANLHAEESAQKRGGGRAALPFDDVEAIIPAAPDDPAAAFDREWALGLFEGALGDSGGGAGVGRAARAGRASCASCSDSARRRPTRRWRPSTA